MVFRYLYVLPFLLVILFVFGSDTCNKNIETKYVNGRSDHLNVDVVKEAQALGLTDRQISIIQGTIESEKLKDTKLHQIAKETDVVINNHLVYRYFASAEWEDTFHGSKVDDAIVETVKWRNNFNINSLNLAEIKPLVSKGLAYTSSALDKYGRAIVYFKIGRNIKVADKETYLKLLLYTVERADRMSVESGSGEFIAIVDLEGLSIMNCPPMSVIKTGLSLLKKNYPYRLSKIFVINSGTVFHMMWNIIKPLMPKRALLKTFVMNKLETDVLDTVVGLENLEDKYGGVLKEDLTDIDAYFNSGYWK